MKDGSSFPRKEQNQKKVSLYFVAFPLIMNLSPLYSSFKTECKIFLHLFQISYVLLTEVSFFWFIQEYTKICEKL